MRPSTSRQVSRDMPAAAHHARSLASAVDGWAPALASALYSAVLGRCRARGAAALCLADLAAPPPPADPKRPP